MYRRGRPVTRFRSVQAGGFGGLARAAPTVAAVAVAVASLGTVALGSDSARGREGTSRSIDVANALAAGRDGKLVAAGLSRRGSHGPRFALARYTAGGTPRPPLRNRRQSADGLRGAQSYAGATSLAIRHAGKIVVAGWAVLPPRINSPFALARYTVSGKLDRTFGRKAGY